MISHDAFFDFIVNAVDNPETPPPTMIVSLIPKELFSSSEGEDEDEDARTTKLLPLLLPLLERAARTLRVLLVDDTFARLMLFFLVPIEDIPVVIVIVIINSFLYEYLRTASISLLREDDRRYISAARFSGVVQNARVLKQRESERERERTHASKI
jgi:hypothetical protein